MVTGTWKKRERQIAGYFGSVRNPLSGSNSKHSCSDSLHPGLYIESKYRKQHSAVTLWRDTKIKDIKENKIPIVALCEKKQTGVLDCGALNRF